jgi:hypothetical protein
LIALQQRRDAFELPPVTGIKICETIRQNEMVNEGSEGHVWVTGLHLHFAVLV